MVPGTCDRLARLAIGLPEQGVSVGDDPLLTAALRAALQLDSFVAAEEIRTVEVYQAKLEVMRERERERKRAQGLEKPRQEQRRTLG